MWHRIFDCQEGSREIDRDGLRPIGKREFFNRSPHAIDASIGEYNVDPPPAVKHLLYCPLHLIFLSDIGHESYRLFAVTLDLGRCLLDFMSGTAKCRNPDSLLCQQHGRGLSNTRTCSGDKRYFACQFHYTSFLLIHVPRKSFLCEHFLQSSNARQRKDGGTLIY